MQFCEINICQVMILCLHLHVFILFVTIIRSYKLKTKPEKISSTIASARKFLLPNVLSEINFISSTKESENKGAECIFCKGKFSEDERGKIWIKCLSCSLWALLTVPQQRTQSISVSLQIDSKQKWFSIILKI